MKNFGNNLPKISKKSFTKLLRTKPQDKITNINKIENQLKKYGGVFTPPRPHSSVILLLSGGLDSIASWGILMEEYKLKVYPLTIDRGQKKRKSEEKAIRFFNGYYKKKYPDLFVQPFNVSASFPQLEISMEKATQLMHPKSITDNLNSFSLLTTNMSLGSFTISPILGKIYSRYLYLTKNINIDTIFCGILPDDGNVVPEQSYTAIRAVALMLRLSTNNPKWQFSSVCYEKETGSYYQKSDLVKWCYDHDIPIEKSWTCCHSDKFHCGQCMSCLSRKDAFATAKVADKTKYTPKQLPTLITRIRYKLHLASDN